MNVAVGLLSRTPSWIAVTGTIACFLAPIAWRIPLSIPQLRAVVLAAAAGAIAILCKPDDIGAGDKPSDTAGPLQQPAQTGFRTSGGGTYLPLDGSKKDERSL